jgi:hypothetical protein
LSRFANGHLPARRITSLRTPFVNTANDDALTEWVASRRNARVPEKSDDTAAFGRHQRGEPSANARFDATDSIFAQLSMSAS